MGKTDSTGTFAYLCDGTAPGSSVLSDGAAVYTPGQSERRGGASSYPDFDGLGNILTLDAAAGQTTLAGYLGTSFGSLMYGYNSSPTPFKFGGGNGCLTDSDTGLVLMGHRYYDTRIGRFITADPAGDGDNWYAYAGNNPVNATDPSGLERIFDPDMANAQYNGQDASAAYNSGEWGTYDWFASDGRGGMKYQGTEVIGPSYADFFMQGGMGLNMGGQRSGGGAFAGGASEKHEPLWDYLKRQFMSGGLADHHNFPQVPFGTVNPFTGGGGGHDPDKTVDEILKGKKGSIKNAPLEKGAPSWQDIGGKPWKEILKGAQGRKPGYDTFRKLLTDKRFNK